MSNDHPKQFVIHGQKYQSLGIGQYRAVRDSGDFDVSRNDVIYPKGVFSLTQPEHHIVLRVLMRTKPVSVAEHGLIKAQLKAKRNYLVMNALIYRFVHGLDIYDMNLPVRYYPKGNFTLNPDELAKGQATSEFKAFDVVLKGRQTPWLADDAAHVALTGYAVLEAYCALKEKVKRFGKLCQDYTSEYKIQILRYIPPQYLKENDFFKEFLEGLKQTNPSGLRNLMMTGISVKVIVDHYFEFFGGKADTDAYILRAIENFFA